MIRVGAAAVVAAGGLAGLGYYLVVSGKLTIDMAGVAGPASRPVRRSDRGPGLDRVST
jgi:hypothetical protein